MVSSNDSSRDSVEMRKCALSYTIYNNKLMTLAICAIVSFPNCSGTETVGKPIKRGAGAEVRRMAYKTDRAPLSLSSAA